MAFSWKGPLSGILRALALGGAVVLPAGVLPAAHPTPAAAAAARPLTCAQTSVSRAAYKRAVSGTVDSGDTLLSATVTRVATGKTDISSGSPALDNGFLNGYYLQHYGWNSWNLGTLSGGLPTTYYLMLPDTAIPTGTPVNGLVYIDYGPQGGANSFQMSCTAG